MKNLINILLCVLLYLSLIAPHLQKRFGIFKEKPLAGYVSKIEKTKIGIKALWTTDYQSHIESYISRNFGLRPPVVRFYNQLLFWAFKTTNAYSIIVSKDNTLFAKGYINAYTGKDYIGKEKIQNKAAKILKVQHDLETKNKNFLVVFAASKPRYFKDKIPGYYLDDVSVTNYDAYMKTFDELDINCIDFNPVFLSLKPVARYPLYPKLGIHWSAYGSYLAADSLVRYIERIRGADLPDISVESITVRPAVGADNDIEQSLNLLFPIRDREYAYPELAFDTINKDRPNVLVVADSFYWLIYGLGVQQHVFGNRSKFWYYFQEVYPDNKTSHTNARDLNFKEEMDKFDVIVLLTQDGSLRRFAYDFIEEYCRQFPGTAND